MNTYIARAAVHFLKIKNVLVLCLLFQLHLLRAQEKPAFAPGKIQLTVAFSLIPVNKTDTQLRFRYIDGPPAGAYPPDTISADYRLQRQRFGQAIKVGVGYFVNKNLRASFSVTPQLAAFKSNKAKNTNVYGVQFDVGLDYFAAI